jgi:WD40 repeat protein
MCTATGLLIVFGLFESFGALPAGEPVAPPTRAMVLTAHFPVRALAFRPDGQQLALLANRLEIYDVPSGKLLVRTDDWGREVSYSPNGQYLMTVHRHGTMLGVDGRVRVLDSATGKRLHQVDGVAARFSPDSTRLLFVGGYERFDRKNAPPRLYLLDLKAGKDYETDLECGDILTRSPEFGGWGTAGPEKDMLAFSKDGKWLVGKRWDDKAKKYNVTICAVATGKKAAKPMPEPPLQVSEDPGTGPDDKLVPSPKKGDTTVHATSRDRTLAAVTAKGGSVSLVDLKTGKELRCLRTGGHATTVECLAYNPGGLLLASGDRDHTVILWDVKTGQEKMRLEEKGEGVRGIHWRPDGKRLATAGWHGITIWDTAAGKKQRFLEAPHANSVAFSPDGKKLASVHGRDQIVKVWEAESGKLLLTLKHDQWVNSLAFSPDGSRLATSDGTSTNYYGKGSVRLWDAATGKPLRVIQAETRRSVHDLAFGPDGKFMVGVDEKSVVTVLDAQTGKELRWFQHTRYRGVMALSPDGRRVAIGGTDGLIEEWDATTGKQLRSFYGHHYTLHAVTYSPDGARLATTDQDGDIYIWDVSK